MSHTFRSATSSLIAVFVLLLAFGAGCTPSTQKLERKALPEKVISRIEGIPEHWSQIGVAMGTSTVRIAFPGVVTPIEGSNQTQVVQADMGTAVLDPRDLAVPTRSLKVHLLRPDDKRLKDCAFSETGWGNGKTEVVQKNLTFGSFPHSFCQTGETDAAMGNRYYMHSFATKIGDRVLVLEFLVHSVVCENFEKPNEQCIAYDEKRDTALFAEVLSRLTVE